MKKLSLFIVTAFLISTASVYANWPGGAESVADHAATLRQASNELKASNPDLSRKLANFADKKEEMAKDWTEGSKMMEQKKKDLSTISQAARVIEPTDKQLSDQLNDISDRWQKKLDKKAEGKV